jgi:hypothetical protein
MNANADMYKVQGTDGPDMAECNKFRIKIVNRLE